MRPQPILWFERAYLLNVALGAASVLAYWGDLRRVAQAGLLAATAVLFLVLLAILTLLVSRRRSRVARWIIVILTLAGVAISIPALPMSMRAGPRGWLGVAQLLLQIAAVACLFTPAARLWLRRPRGAF